MAGPTGRFEVVFPDYYDDRREFETPFKGYLQDVVVQMEDGNRYRLTFYDPVRLQQNLAENQKEGTPYFAEPNLIVLPEVTTDSIRKAVEGLVKERFFEHLKPL